MILHLMFIYLLITGTLHENLSPVDYLQHSIKNNILVYMPHEEKAVDIQKSDTSSRSSVSGGLS